jgi:hypothetical protein
LHFSGCEKTKRRRSSEIIIGPIARSFLDPLLPD